MKRIFRGTNPKKTVKKVTTPQTPHYPPHTCYIKKTQKKLKNFEEKHECCETLKALQYSTISGKNGVSNR